MNPSSFPKSHREEQLIPTAPVAVTHSGGGRLAGWTPVLITVVAWATAFPAIRIAVRGLLPGALALSRFVIASTIFLGALALGRVRIPSITRRDSVLILGAGFTGITLYHLALNFGEQVVQAGTASLLVNLAPIFTSLLAAALFRERLTRWWWAGLGTAFLGCILISVGHGLAGGHWLGVGSVLAAAIFQSAFFVLQKPLLSRMTPLSVTALSVWVGTVPLLAFGGSLASSMPTLQWSTALAAAYLGLVPSALAYFTWAKALSQRPASEVAVFLYLVPPIAMTVGWLALGERLGMVEATGAALALGGVMMTRRSASPRQTDKLDRTGRRPEASIGR